MAKLLNALQDNKKVTQKRKNEAILALAKATDRICKRPDPENDPWSYMDDDTWQLAEFRKWGYVRVIKDKLTKHWITTTYGKMERDTETGYYGLDINTGLMIPQDRAKELYHTSRA